MMRYRGITLEASEPPPAEDYRRQARRLRCAHAGNPIRLHQSLALLAESQPARPPTVPPVSPETFFAELVATELSAGGSVLRYSRRLELIREAERRGLSRFQANLIIAQVQYHTPEDGSNKTFRRSWAGIVLMFLATQAFIGTMIWLTIL